MTMSNNNNNNTMPGTEKNEQPPASERTPSKVSSEGHDALASAEGESTRRLPPSTDSTPGVDVSMPGGLPVGKQHEEEVAKDVEYVKQAAFGVLESAKQAAQGATQSAQCAMQTAGERVGGRLPASVAPYLPHALQEVGGQQSKSERDTTKRSTLPSEEVSQNCRPSSEGGVGTLPGPPGEIGVAVLPEERMEGKSVVEAGEESVKSTSPIMTTTNNNIPILPPPPPPPSHSHPRGPLSRHTGFIPGALQDDTSLAKLPEERRLEKLPSHDDETGGRLGKSGGVGALPGSANESGVALLPDERKAKEREESKGSDVVEAAAAATSSSAEKSGRHEGDSSASPQDEVSKTARTGPDSPLKKLGFMDKVKGEMKILSGKMGHNESKVEEGRKLMGKN